MFKKHWFVCLASAFLITAIITGCETLQKADTSGGREYFPNTDGYSWTFRLSSPSTSETMTAKYTVNGTTEVAGLTVQKVKIEITSGSQVSTSEYLVRVTDSDVSLYGPSDHPTTEATKVIVFPLSVGSSWYFFGTQEASVIAQENVSVTAGIYNSCFKTRMSSSSPSWVTIIDFWLAKNTGVAKVLMTTTQGTTETSTLVELTAKSF